MPRHLVVDRPAMPAKAPKMGPLRRLWRHFVGGALDREPLRGFSSHQLRDIGLGCQSAGDGEEPWKRLK